MESWEHPTSTPQVKFEASPAESFVSTPGEMYPSLFSGDVSVDDAMTPQSPSAEGTVDTPDATPASDKKAVKKRKSWGQVLPEPKTNLPPRKRAKTEDEKEQRRVERVLRNRRAAQFSRERKRQEVEALEKRNQELEALLQHHQTQNAMLLEELSKLRRSSGVLTRGSSPTLQPSPITLSQPLFGAGSDSKADMMDDFILMESNQTVDPASLSPELTPVADDETDAPAPTKPALAAEAATEAGASSDVTQHPAAVLCDLQCPSVEVPPSWPASQPRSPPALTLFLQLQFLLTASSAMLSACRNPLKLIAGALKHSLVLQATPSITSTIIWMVTLPPECRISTFPSSLTTASAALLQARPRAASRSPKISTPASAFSTLRIKSLQKLLTCSPSLARPLKDATLGLLRLVSEGRDDRVERLADGAPNIEGDQSRGPLLWPDGASLPSREVLLTLLWAIRVEERKMKAGEANTASQPASTIRPGSSVLQDKTNHTHILSVAMKRKSDMELTSSKRLRLGY